MNKFIFIIILSLSSSLEYQQIINGINVGLDIIKYINNFVDYSKKGENEEIKEKNSENNLKNNVEKNDINSKENNLENNLKNNANKENGKNDIESGKDTFEKFVKVGSLAKNLITNGIVLKTFGFIALADIGYKTIKYFKRQSNSEKFNQKWEEKINELIKILIRKTEEKFNDYKLHESEKKSVSEKSKDKIKKIFNEEKEKIFDNLYNFISGNILIEDIIEDKIEQIKHINVIIFGASQIGKTTLINNILFLSDEKKGKVGGKGESTTFSSDILKHIQITDTRGIEKGKFNLESWIEENKKQMNKDLKEGNFGDLIHAIWYGVNDIDEIQDIKNVSKIFEGYNIPIIFVYLKPYEGDIKIIKKRTSIINNNFIVVQSYDYIKKCNESGGSEFVQDCRDLLIKQKNMDKLLFITKNLAFEGIVNSIGSKISSDIKEEMKKQFKKRIVEEKIKIILNYQQEKKEQNQKNSYENFDLITQRVEKILEIIIELFEEILFGKNSKEHFSIKSRNIISEIQKEIKSSYYNFYIKDEQDILVKYKSIIEEEKESLHCKEKDEYWWFGINDINKEEFKKNFKLVENEFKRGNLAFKYSMIKSIDELYNILEENVSIELEEKIQKIISNKILKKKLEDKIKKICENKIKNLTKEFEDEINSAFPQK